VALLPLCSLGEYRSVDGLTIGKGVFAELQLGCPLDDVELAARLGVSRRLTVNHVRLMLERSARLPRFIGQDGKIVNDWGDAPRGWITRKLTEASPPHNVRQASESTSELSTGRTH
jgi:hypothetical protein